MSIKQVQFSHALLVFVGLFAAVATGMFYLDQLLHVVLFVALVWVAINARILGYQYLTIREMMNAAITKALPATYIFLLKSLICIWHALQVGSHAFDINW